MTDALATYPIPLRSLAERVADVLPKGLWPEILDGCVVVPLLRSARHAGAISRIHSRLLPQLPEDLGCYQVVAVGESGENTDYVIPDLLVMPIAETHKDGWLIGPGVVRFVLEVVSMGCDRTDTDIKPRVYARMGIPIYLLVNPHDASMVCYSAPRDGEFCTERRLTFGDTVVLPEPLGEFRIRTEDLPRYD